MKLQTALVLLLLLTSLLFLSACNGQTAAPDTEDTQAVQATASEEPAEADPETEPEAESEEAPPVASAPSTAKAESVSPSLAMTADGEHPQLIAHAGGSIYGYRLTNSLEALNHSYAEGFRYIEVDLNKTTDGALVLIHDWEAVAKRLLGHTGPCSLRAFQESPTMAGLTLLTLDDLLKWLADHPDCTIITDIKYEDNCTTLEQLAKQAGDQVSQFIPQAFSYEEFDKIRKLGFDRVILTLYQLYGKALKLDELIDFAYAKNPWAITIPENRLDKALVSALSKEAIEVYAHAVNTVDAVDEWHRYGLTGIYTDYFLPSHWIY